ncbi:MAG: hypothetical protein LBP33_10850 [Candidatus Adiutrix sp.]|jgi:hypothetical protein|nr:hypothetical protein [Candidatus Adiutrix sp.]
MPQNNMNPQEMNPQDDRRPKLRCPACASLVTLPAEKCPRCGAHLRTGYRPEAEEAPGWRGRLILGLAVLILVIASAALFFVLSADNQPKAAAGPSPLKPGALGETLDGAQNLSDLPLALQPGPILDLTREKAGQLEDRWPPVEDPYTAGN